MRARRTARRRLSSRDTKLQRARGARAWRAAVGSDPQRPELASALRTRRPDLPVVFMSGQDAVLDTLPLTVGRDFIRKPFLIAELQALLSGR